MTSSYPGPPSPLAGADGHVNEELLTGYAAGTVDTVVVWSVEAHLTRCTRCRSALSAQVDAGRLERNRSSLLVSIALPHSGPVRRLLRRCGAPDHLLDLVAVTPSLRRSWLLSIIGVLAVVVGEAAAVGSDWTRAHTGAAGHPSPELLAPFLLIAPLLVLAGVAAAFLPMFDPAHRLAVAAPFSGVRLLLVRTVSALCAALVPVAGAAFVVPGPRWLPIALLLPALALCSAALAAATVMDPRAAVLAVGALWALPTLLLMVSHVPLLIVQPTAQFACAAVFLISAVVLYLRHDRVELGWTR